MSSGPAAVRVNPDLEALRCLRCAASLPVADLFEGCPRCGEEGHAGSLVAGYRPSDGAAGAPRLPLLDAPTLGEGDTALIPLPWLARSLEMGSVALKAEYLNPTGSHKDRMSRYAAAWAAHRGWRTVIAASSGNAGVSLTAYAARLGLECILLTGADPADSWPREMKRYGARVEYLAEPHQRWQRQKELVDRGDIFAVTNHVRPAVGSNPFGVQGYKTAGYELFAQTRGEVDLVLVPTARGDLLWGVWTGFVEAAGDAGQNRLPRMVAVEPYPRLSRILDGADYRDSFPGTTWQQSIGGDTATWQSVHTLQASGGWAMVVGDREAAAAQEAMYRRGIPLESCSAAPVAALRTLRDDGRAGADTRVVLLGTSDGRHEPEAQSPSP